MSNRLVSGIVLLALLCVCAVSAQTPGVSAAEQKEGFKAAFDGQSLKGWTPRPPPAGRGSTEPPATGKWAAQSGELVWVKDSGRGYLVTDQVYTDFTLRLDFFADAPANTGVNFGIPDTGLQAPATGTTKFRNLRIKTS
jgi:hypothetical protein